VPAPTASAASTVAMSVLLNICPSLGTG
jgi:hypothetical protein